MNFNELVELVEPSYRSTQIWSIKNIIDDELILFYRRPSFVIQRWQRSHSLVFLQLGTSADQKSRGGLARCSQHLSSSLHGRRVPGDPSGKRIHQAKISERWAATMTRSSRFLFLSPLLPVYIYIYMSYENSLSYNLLRIIQEWLIRKSVISTIEDKFISLIIRVDAM